MGRYYHSAISCLILIQQVLIWSTVDPAAEQFNYPVSLDIKELVTLDDVMEELNLGPNG